MQTYNHTTIQPYNHKSMHFKCNHTTIQPYKHITKLRDKSRSYYTTSQTIQPHIHAIKQAKNPTTLQQYKPLNCAAIKLTTRQSFDHITIQTYNHTTIQPCNQYNQYNHTTNTTMESQIHKKTKAEQREIET